MNIKTKITETFIAVALCGFAAEIQPLDFKTCTEADVRAKVEECLATTNQIERIRNLSLSKIVGYMITRKDLDDLRAELDTRFAAEGLSFTDYCYGGWPKTCAQSIAKMEKTHPVRAALIKKYGAMRWIGCPLNCYTAEELIAFLNECLAQNDWALQRNINTMILFNKQAIKIVRRHLYEQGKSFITKDGVNPCEQYLTEFTAAINAPRLAGLNEWLAKMGVSYRVNLDFLPSAEEVSKLELDILTGEKDITEKYKVILYFGLGAEKYNAFVKRYNGDK